MTKKKTSNKPQEDRVKTEEITENLKCMLSTEELRQASELAARFVQQTVQLEADKKTMMASFKAKIDAANAGLIDQSNQVRDKYTYRDVPCFKIMNFTTTTITVTRLDTNTEIENRKMTLPEKNADDLFSL